MKERRSIDNFFRGAAIAGVIASPSAVDAAQTVIRPFPAEVVVYPPGEAKIAFIPQEEESVVAPEQLVAQDFAKKFIEEKGWFLEQAGFDLQETHLRVELGINDSSLFLRRYEPEDQSASYVYTIAFQENGKLALVIEDFSKEPDDSQRLRFFLLYADEAEKEDLLVTDIDEVLVLRAENVLDEAGEVVGNVPWPIFDEEGNLVELFPVPAQTVKLMDAGPDAEKPGEYLAEEVILGGVAGLKIPGSPPAARVEKAEGEPVPTIVPVEAKEIQRPTATVTARGLNVRLGPGTDYEKSITLLQDAAVEVIGFSGNWLKISVDGVEGWISGSDEYIVRTGDFTTVPEISQDQIPVLPQPAEQPQPIEERKKVVGDRSEQFDNWLGLGEKRLARVLFFPALEKNGLGNVRDMLSETIGANAGYLSERFIEAMTSEPLHIGFIDDDPGEKRYNWGFSNSMGTPARLEPNPRWVEVYRLTGCSEEQRAWVFAHRFMKELGMLLLAQKDLRAGDSHKQGFRELNGQDFAWEMFQELRSKGRIDDSSWSAIEGSTGGFYRAVEQSEWRQEAESYGPIGFWYWYNQ